MFPQKIAGVGGTSIGTTAVVVGALQCSAVTLKLMPSATGTVYIGGGSAVGTATGYPLTAGQSLDLGVGSLQDIWAIASAAGQDLRWLALSLVP